MHRFPACPYIGLSLIATLAVATVAHSQQAHPSGERTNASDAPEKPEGAAATALQESMRLMMPGEHHKHLEYFIGKWKTTMKAWAGGPDQPPMESHGTSEVGWILGKRFVEENYRGDFMGMPYEGRGMTGYDNFRKCYTSTWASNLATYIQHMSGHRNADGTRWVYFGEMDEPGVTIGRMLKFVRRIEGPDKFVFQIFDSRDGDEIMPIEITYERVK